MTVEIKTSTLEPVRQTFANLERRFGDKPASRYQEATYDLQAEILRTATRQNAGASREQLQLF